VETFEFLCTTRILFGKGQIENLPLKLGEYGKRVLLTYGGGSIKKSGLYDKIKDLLSDFEVYELGGIEPNPKVDSVYAGKEICRSKGIEVILAVGGGSTLDCSKAIAAAALYDGDAWELILHSEKITTALPVCTILTLTGASSEMDDGGVLSNPATNEKLFFSHESLLPRFSILDPEYTYSVSKLQTASGAADIMCHVFEQYFTNSSILITDGICEGILRTIIKYGPIAVNNPEDYEARGQLMWGSALANTHLCSTGNVMYAWCTHAIEHELSAHYDITHGIGCAIITPRWMRYILNDQTVDRFVEYGMRVWDVNKHLDKFTIAHQAIDRTEDLFKRLGLPMTLSALNINSDKFEIMAEHVLNTPDQHIGNVDRDAWVSLKKQDVMNILKMCL
jgi:alcohol dehydrogenase YqhD (iron-dependent ADH family)